MKRMSWSTGSDGCKCRRNICKALAIGDKATMEFDGDKIVITAPKSFEGDQPA